MTAHLSTMMLRSTAKKTSVVALSRIAGAKGAILRGNLPSSCLAMKNFSTFPPRHGNKSESTSSSHDLEAAHLIEPLPALAYDDFDDHLEGVNDIAGDDVRRIKNSAGGRIFNNTTTATSASSTFEGKTLPLRKSGSGGGSGRHVCPKCGTDVTFRSDDFEKNTYYCATCSGWFLLDPNKDGKRDPTYEEFMAKNGRTGAPQKQTQDPQILMHHVRHHD